MTQEQLDLRKKLEEYFNRFCGSSTFLQRLAQENGWSAFYTRRVLMEYQKFLFIAREGGHHVTPSKPIDKAWHLHLLYTESYWGEFCPKVLGMSLHHQPSVGVAGEEGKFRDDFRKTLESYLQFFGDYPMDIWGGVMQASGTNILRWLIAACFGSAIGFLGALVLGLALQTSFVVEALIFLMITGLVGWAIYRTVQLPREKREEKNSNCGGGEGGGGSSCGSESSAGHGGHGCGSGHSGCGGGSSCGGGGCGGGGGGH